MERITRNIMGIKFNKSQMIEMENIVKKFLKNHDIKLTIPVDIFNIATQLDFDVRGANLPKNTDGMILVNEQVDKINKFNSNKIIAYSSKKAVDFQKFIVAHELSHYIDEKAENSGNQVLIAFRDKNIGYSSNKNEQRIDYMSAALLVPKDDLITHLNQNTTLSDQEFIQTMSEHYNIDAEVIKRRIEEVRIQES